MQTSDKLRYFQVSWIKPTDLSIESDVVIYGVTAAGVIAAISLTERGCSVFTSTLLSSSEE